MSYYNIVQIHFTETAAEQLQQQEKKLKNYTHFVKNFVINYTKQGKRKCKIRKNGNKIFNKLKIKKRKLIMSLKKNVL